MHLDRGSHPSRRPGRDRARGLRVLVVGDDPRVRRMMRRVLPGVLVVAEAHGVRGALGAARYYRPEVVVIDAARLDGGSLELVEELATDVDLDTKIVLLCGSGRDDLPYLALRKGALGCVNKQKDLASLHFVLREVREGRAALSQTIVGDLARRLRALPEGQVGVRPVRSVLTGREWETVDQLCLHRSTVEIARTLGLSVETVRMHIKNIMRKLDVHSRAEIVAAVQILRAREVLSHAALAAAAADRR